MLSVFQESFLSCFDDVDDPRVERGQLHFLEDILVIAICAVIAGADGWNDMETFGRSRYDWLKTFLDLPNGIPTHDTFRRVISRLDPDQFATSFLRWTSSLMNRGEEEYIAVDGKTLRHSGDSSINQRPIHMVSAWATHNRLILAQLMVDQKSNEITAIPELLRALDLTNATVSIDAMGCQTAIAQQIVDQGGNYILRLKDNQPTLSSEVQDMFEQSVDNGVAIEVYETHEQDHGRIERRRYSQLMNVEDISIHQAWPHLHSVIMMETQRIDAHTISSETRYFIASSQKSVQDHAMIIRSHWGIENSVHWVLDVVFDEDASRIHMDHGPQNVAVLRHIALNLLRKETTYKASIRTKRYRATLDQNYLLRVLNGLT